MEARKIRPIEAFQCTGTVERIEGPLHFVRTEHGVIRSRRAISCLVEAAVSDLVLVASDEAGGAWVLAVLERDDAGACLSVEGDLDIRLRDGSLRVVTQGGIDLVSAKRLAFSAPEATWSTRALSVMSEKLSVIGDVLSAQLQKARVESTVIESLGDRFFQRVKQSYRRVDEVDQVRAHRIDYKGEQLMALHGGSTVVTANELVKVDGSQVHVG